MLSGLLKNDIAIQVSINIMNAFVEMRKIIANNFNINNRISTLEYQMIECNQKFEKVFDELQKNLLNNYKTAQGFQCRRRQKHLLWRCFLFFLRFLYYKNNPQ